MRKNQWSTKRPEAFRKYMQDKVGYDPKYINKNRQHFYNVRRVMAKRYGVECVVCGENNIENLRPVKLNADGLVPDNERGRWIEIARRIRSDDYPDGYEMYCNDCYKPLCHRKY